MHRATRVSLRHRLLASSVWVLVATAALPALAAPDAVQVDVAAGALDGALTSLATQTRQQILYTADLVANRRAPALKGAYTPDEALDHGGLVQDDVIDHGSCPRAEPAAGS